jgi:L-threonylcarbamoyladenylate synthase
MTLGLETRVLAPGREAIASAARCLAQGGLVAFPTETVYGLGADAGNGAAVARLYAAKQRPSFNPLIVHTLDRSAAGNIARFNDHANALARAFWPGPLTLVLPKLAGCGIADLATAGLDTVAVRVPDHPVARDILRQFARPVVAPSANRSGHVSPTTAQHVWADLNGRIDMIIDGGATGVGVESTIVACIGDAPQMLRPGGIARKQIEAVLDCRLAAPAPNEMHAPTAPGQLASHYATKARLRLDAQSVAANEALLAFGRDLPTGAEQACAVRNLSPRGDLIEAAANLFSYLRELDQAGAQAIAAMPVPHEGIGEAINDRLRRAAAPR